MAYKVIILYQLYMPSYFLGTFTEYPKVDRLGFDRNPLEMNRRNSGRESVFIPNEVPPISKVPVTKEHYFFSPFLSNSGSMPGSLPRNCL